MSPRYWQVRGFDSFEKIFDMVLEVGQITYDQVKQLLKALSAKAGLEYAEIVGAYPRIGTALKTGGADVRFCDYSSK